MENQPLLLSLHDGAQRLGGISVRTLQRLIERGEIRAVYINRRCLVPVAELDRYVAELTAA